MATAPTDPNKLNQQPSSDITSSVNKFAGDVGAGAFNTAREAEKDFVRNY